MSADDMFIFEWLSRGEHLREGEAIVITNIDYAKVSTITDTGARLTYVDTYNTDVGYTGVKAYDMSQAISQAESKQERIPLRTYRYVRTDRKDDYSITIAMKDECYLALGIEFTNYLRAQKALKMQPELLSEIRKLTNRVGDCAAILIKLRSLNFWQRLKVLFRNKFPD